jgi:hypothetical protein
MTNDFFKLQYRRMPEPSLESKNAYCVRTRRSNCLASLRLSGFNTTPLDIPRPLPTREELLKTYRNTP